MVEYAHFYLIIYWVTLIFVKGVIYMILQPLLERYA